MLFVQSSYRATGGALELPKSQRVSFFRQSIACRKEGIFESNWRPYNLSIFNSLRRVFAATKGWDGPRFYPTGFSS
jgi:hypothetical protein